MGGFCFGFYRRGFLRGVLHERGRLKKYILYSTILSFFCEGEGLCGVFAGQIFSGICFDFWRVMRFRRGGFLFFFFFLARESLLFYVFL